MTELSPVAAPALADADRAVQTAFAAARDANWPPELKTPLWQAGVAALLAYADIDPDAPRVVGYAHLVVDLAPDDGDWPAPVRRAVRLAAGHALARPAKPHHPARAKGLLRRLDALDRPTRAARERALAAIALRLQALSGQRLEANAPEDRLFRLQSEQLWLSRLSEAIRALSADVELAERRALLDRVHEAVTDGRLADGAHDPDALALLHALRHDGAALPRLTALTDAIAAIRHAPSTQHRAARLELLAMLIDLDLGALDAADVATLKPHLAMAAHLARAIADVPDESLPALLTRLRLRLQANGRPAFEPLIDEAVALIERLEARRVEAAALMAAVEAEDWDPDEIRQERARYQQQLRAAGWMLDAVGRLRLSRADAALSPRLIQLLQQLDALATDAALAPDEVRQAVELIERQLENPALVTSRAWLAGQTTLQQLAAQRRALADSLRGLGLERHLEPGDRQAQRARMKRQLDDLDAMRHILATLPLDRVAHERESEAYGALQAITRAVRLLLASDDRSSWRSAMHAASAICG